MRAEHFSDDVLDFLRAIARHGARALLVGGEAVIHYGYPRLTGDTDFFFEQTEANAAAMYAALRDFWEGPPPGLQAPADLLVPGLILRYGLPPNRIDLLGGISGISFDEAWAHRQEILLEGPDDQVPLCMISKDDLIRNKRAAGRFKDLDDVEVLTGQRESGD